MDHGTGFLIMFDYIISMILFPWSFWELWQKHQDMLSLVRVEVSLSQHSQLSKTDFRHNQIIQTNHQKPQIFIQSWVPRSRACASASLCPSSSSCFRWSAKAALWTWPARRWRRCEARQELHTKLLGEVLFAELAFWTVELFISYVYIILIYFNLFELLKMGNNKLPTLKNLGKSKDWNLYAIILMYVTVTKTCSSFLLRILRSRPTPGCYFHPKVIFQGHLGSYGWAPLPNDLKNASENTTSKDWNSCDMFFRDSVRLFFGKRVSIGPASSVISQGAIHRMLPVLSFYLNVSQYMVQL